MTDIAGLIASPIAHRGLWSPGGAPENSLAAFEAAAEAGYGIELDVQLSSDGEAMVFHDDSLQRLTTAEGRLKEQTAAELGSLRLGDSEERIPTLAEVLERVDGRVPVFVELKVLVSEEGPLERRVAELLAPYSGPAGLLAFNPHALAAFEELAPERPRGLNSLLYTDAAQWPMTPDLRAALNGLFHAGPAKAQFLSLSQDMLPSVAADALRMDGMPVIAWTIRSPAQWSRVRSSCDGYIFEGYRP